MFFQKRVLKNVFCNFIKKRLQHRRFPVNIAKFLMTLFFTEHRRWLLLHTGAILIRSLIKYYKLLALIIHLIAICLISRDRKASIYQIKFQEVILAYISQKL